MQAAQILHTAAVLGRCSCSPQLWQSYLAIPADCVQPYSPAQRCEDLGQDDVLLAFPVGGKISSLSSMYLSLLIENEQVRPLRLFVTNIILGNPKRLLCSLEGEQRRPC